MIIYRFPEVVTIMKKLEFLFLFLLFSLLLAATVFADEGRDEIPAQVPKGHWSCKEISELAAKYGALKKLPEKETTEKKELAAALFELLKKVQTKCELAGRDAV